LQHVYLTGVWLVTAVVQTHTLSTEIALKMLKRGEYEWKALLGVLLSVGMLLVVTMETFRMI